MQENAILLAIALQKKMKMNQKTLDIHSKKQKTSRLMEEMFPLLMALTNLVLSLMMISLSKKSRHQSLKKEETRCSKRFGNGSDVVDDWKLERLF